MSAAKQSPPRRLPSWRVWLRVGVTALIVVVAGAYFLDLGRLGRELAAASIPLIVATIVLATLDTVYMGVKWNILLRLFGIRVRAMQPVAIYFRGRILTVLIPSILGLDAYRAYAVVKLGAKPATALSSIFVERFVGMLSSLAVVALLLPFAAPVFGYPVTSTLVALAILGYVSVWSGLALLVRYSDILHGRAWPAWIPAKPRKMLSSFGDALSTVRGSPRAVYLYFAASQVEKLAYGTCLWLATRAVGVIDIQWLPLVAAAPLVALLDRLPISISAIGVREGAFVVLLAPWGVNPTTAVTIALVLRIAELARIFISLLWWTPGLTKTAAEAESGS